MRSSFSYDADRNGSSRRRGRPTGRLHRTRIEATLLLAFLLLSAAPTGSAPTPQLDRSELARLLDSLDGAWNAPAYAQLLRLLGDRAVGSEEVERAFAAHLEARPLTRSLAHHLFFATVQASTQQHRAKMQTALAPLLARRIDTAFRAQLPHRLGPALEADPVLREDLWAGMRLLARIAHEGQHLPVPVRRQARARLVALVHAHPDVLSQRVHIDPTRQPWLPLFRAHLLQLIRDLDGADRAALVTELGFEGLRAEIVRAHGVLVLDNQGLDKRQLRLIRDMLDAIPPELHALTRISVFDFLRHRDLEPYWLRTLGGSLGVNIFGLRVEARTENPFPSDVQPVSVSVFRGALQHELNHAIDHASVSGSDARRARWSALLRQAGKRDARQYLRSGFGPDFFHRNPYELFASIANQYFTDSGHTLELALRRFENGRKEPLNQFLLVADVYARGGSHTRFYALDGDGGVSFVPVPVGRNAHGHIDRIRWQGAELRFARDRAGNVNAVARETALN